MQIFQMMKKAHTSLKTDKSGNIIFFKLLHFLMRYCVKRIDSEP